MHMNPFLAFSLSLFLWLKHIQHKYYRVKLNKHLFIQMHIIMFCNAFSWMYCDYNLLTINLSIKYVPWWVVFFLNMQNQHVESFDRPPSRNSGTFCYLIVWKSVVLVKTLSSIIPFKYNLNSCWLNWRSCSVYRFNDKRLNDRQK